MTAREYFEGARSAQQAIDRRYATMEAMLAREGVRAQRYDRLGRGSALPNAVTPTDVRLDYERRGAAEIAALRSQVEDAEAVARGVNAANPTTMLGDVLMLRYCSAMPWQNVAAALGLTPRAAQMQAAQALDWVDAVGIARAREGMGQAQLF